MNRVIKNEIMIIFIACFIRFVLVTNPIEIDENSQEITDNNPEEFDDVALCKEQLLIFSPDGNALTFLDNYLKLNQVPLYDLGGHYKKYSNYVASKIIYQCTYENVFDTYIELIIQDYILQPILFCRHYIIAAKIRAEINEYGQLLEPSSVPGQPATLILINYEHPEDVLLDVDVNTQETLKEKRENCVKSLTTFQLINGMHPKEIFYSFFNNFLFSRAGIFKFLGAYGRHVKNSSRSLAGDTMNIQEYCSSQPELKEFEIRPRNVIKEQSIIYGKGIQIEYYTLSQNQVVQQTITIPKTFSYGTQPQYHGNFTTGEAGPSNQ